jgi:hypothetical protein
MNKERKDEILGMMGEPKGGHYWTEEQDEILKILVEKGFSYTEIYDANIPELKNRTKSSIQQRICKGGFNESN